MNDQEWQELDAQLKRAFDELRATCAKAHKMHKASTHAAQHAAAEAAEQAREASLEEVSDDAPADAEIERGATTRFDSHR
jgi:hypothetical protein